MTTLDDFVKAEPAPDALFYRLDGHLTPAGNKVVADVFLQRVVPLLNAKM
jgi:hypothetical protein